jgi:hypothetical protein
VEVNAREIRARLNSRRRFQWFEADWNYDGKVFRSRARVVRAWRSEAALPTLQHRASRNGTRRTALRAADSSGTIYLAEIPPSVG